MYFPALNFPALDCTALYHTAMHIHALHFSTLNYTSMHCKLLLCTRASKSCRHADARLRKFFQNMRKYFTFERESGENCPNFVFLAQSDKVFFLFWKCSRRKRRSALHYATLHRTIMHCSALQACTYCPILDRYWRI